MIDNVCDEESGLYQTSVDLWDMYVLIDLFERINLGSQRYCSKIYDYVIKKDYLYIETTDHTVYQIDINRTK